MKQSNTLRDHLAGANSSAAFSHYEQRIQTLTSLLNKSECLHPVTNLDPSDPGTNSELRSFYFAATLLMTGSHDHNCAVTAIILPQLVKCIVAIQGDPQHPRTGCTTGIDVHLLSERRLDLQFLASGPSESNVVSFEEHAADVLHALRTFHISTFDNSHDPSAPPSPYWAFLRFVVRRCFLKIAERISNGNKIWRIHPVSVLRSWQPGDAVFKRTEFVLQHPILQATLEVYDVKPVSQTADGRATYYFATDNAKAWAKVACALFGVLEEKLMTLYFDGHTPPKQVPRATMDAESIIIVSDYLDMFSVILDLAPVKEILKHTSYTSRLEPLEEPALASKYSPDAKTDDPDGEALTKEEQESAGGHVFRYLRAIVSWVNASLFLTQHEIFRSRVPIELYLVHVPPERGNQLAAFQSIKEEIFGRLPEDQEQNISAFFNDEEQTLHKFEGSVHTECALMGILSDAGSSDSPPSIQDIFKYNGNRLGNLPDIFKVGYIAIGSTRNCCACCWKLAEELSRKYKREIILSGTHGIVRPWSPPRLGISVDLLGAVDSAMFDTLCALAADPTSSLQLRKTRMRQVTMQAEERKRERSSWNCLAMFC